MSHNSGHLLDALKGRQPDDDDPEQRLASQWRAKPEEAAPSAENVESFRRSRWRRSSESAAEEVEGDGSPSADAYEASGETAGAVRRTRITTAPGATRAKTDAPRRSSAMERLSGIRRAFATGFNPGSAKRSAAHPASSAERDPVAKDHRAAPVSRIKRTVQLTHSEALLFVLVALVVVLSAYVVGKNSSGDDGQVPPALSNSKRAELDLRRKDAAAQPQVQDPKENSAKPAVTPDPAAPPAPAEAWGVRVTSYGDKDEAEKQREVFRSGLAKGSPVEIVEGQGPGGAPEFHLMVGRAAKKDDPALAALADQFRTLALGSKKPYARSVDIRSF